MNTSLNISGQQREIACRPAQALSRLPGAPVPIRHVPSSRGPAVRRRSDFSVSAFQRFSICNECGFWQLTFDSQTAIIKQHPALFFVAWLMENTPTEPLDASALASSVCADFYGHPDFFILLGWLVRQQSATNMGQILVKKERALEAILDGAPIVHGAAELDPVKAEALAELELLYEFQASYFSELTLPTEDATARRVMADLLSLHASLITAVDAQGNPQPVARAFALHLLVYMIMPSIRATALTGHACFVYENSL